MNHWKSQGSQEVDEAGQGAVSAPPEATLKPPHRQVISQHRNTHTDIHTLRNTHITSCPWFVRWSSALLESRLSRDPRAFDLWPKLLWLEVSVTSLWVRSETVMRLLIGGYRQLRTVCSDLWDLCRWPVNSFVQQTCLIWWFDPSVGRRWANLGGVGVFSLVAAFFFLF